MPIWGVFHQFWFSTGSQISPPLGYHFCYGLRFLTVASSKLLSCLKHEREFVMWTSGCVPVNSRAGVQRGSRAGAGPMLLCSSGLSPPSPRHSLLPTPASPRPHSRGRTRQPCSVQSGGSATRRLKMRPLNLSSVSSEGIWSAVGEGTWCRVKPVSPPSGASLSPPSSSLTLGRLLSELHLSRL